MRWQCEHCSRDFSRPYALTQHISQKHPYNQDTTNQTVYEDIDDDIWNLPDYNSSYDYTTENDSDDSLVYEVKFVKEF